MCVCVRARARTHTHTCQSIVSKASLSHARLPGRWPNLWLAAHGLSDVPCALRWGGVGCDAGRLGMRFGNHRRACVVHRLGMRIGFACVHPHLFDMGMRMEKSMMNTVFSIQPRAILPQEFRTHVLSWTSPSLPCRSGPMEGRCNVAESGGADDHHRPERSSPGGPSQPAHVQPASKTMIWVLSGGHWGGPEMIS